MSFSLSYCPKKPWNSSHLCARQYKLTVIQLMQSTTAHRTFMPAYKPACVCTVTLSAGAATWALSSHCKLLFSFIYSGPFGSWQICHSKFARDYGALPSTERGDIWYLLPLLIAWSGGRGPAKWTWNEHHASTHCAYNTLLNPTFFSRYGIQLINHVPLIVLFWGLLLLCTQTQDIICDRPCTERDGKRDERRSRRDKKIHWRRGNPVSNDPVYTSYKKRNADSTPHHFLFWES